MIAFIEGKLVNKQEGSILLECGGMGFEIFVSNNTLCGLPLQNENCKIFIYLHVKEDEMSLYGFLDMEEKSLFMKLLEVSGIGPKGALSMLSGMKLTDLMVAIANQDIVSLSKIKGLGKKTAERVCLELKDKIGFVSSSMSNEIIVNNSVIQDAIEALLSLGMARQDANAYASKCYEEGDTVEDLVTKVFINMGR